MRRKDRQKDEAFAWNVIKKCDYAAFCCTEPDGSPYSVPICPAVLGDSVYFHCALEGKKLDILKKDNRVCLSAVSRAKAVEDKYTMEFDSAVLFGTAEIVEDDSEKIAALRAICDKYAPSNKDGFEAAVKRSLFRTGIVRINVTSLTGKQKRLKPTD